MKGILLGLSLFVLTGSLRSLADPLADAMSKGYTRLTFSDEFNDTGLDRRKWIDCYPDGVRTHTTAELEYFAPDGYFERDGYLTLRAEKRSMGGMDYTSGLVTSYGKFAQQYGWFEIRSKNPKGVGFWPTFWLLPNNKKWPPELDVMEIVTIRPAQVALSNFFKLPNEWTSFHHFFFDGPDFSDDFHVFALEWTPTTLIWYIDGVERARDTDHVPQQAMYVVADLAIGAASSWGGAPNADTVFPADMVIDYIRVYQNPALEPAPANAP